MHGDGHCCMQVIIPVVTLQQEMNQTLAFPQKSTALLQKTEAERKKYNKSKGSLFSNAKDHRIPVFDTKSNLDLKEKRQMSKAWAGGLPAN